MQTRGMELDSKKVGVWERLKQNVIILVPLIITSFDRVGNISNAMDLRGFGKHKKRTWYVTNPLKKNDYIAIAFAIIVLVAALALGIFVNGSRFWNPFLQ